jgi:hypothetical protein
MFTIVYIAVAPVQQLILRQSPTSSTTIFRCIRSLFQTYFLLYLYLISSFSQTSGEPPSVHTAAALFQKLCYENKDALSAGIIVAGWDKQVGPSVYNIPLGGGMFRQPWAIGGSFSTSSCPTVPFYSSVP